MDHLAEVRDVGVSVGDDGHGVPVIVLDVDDRYVPIFVSPEQAQSVQYALHGTRAGRPLTHDLLVEMVADFGCAIDRVRIDDLADGTFYAKVDAERYDDGEREAFVFDARPSDGIALALRVDCPITVVGDVVEAAGEAPEAFDVRRAGRSDAPDEEPDW